MYLNSSVRSRGAERVIRDGLANPRAFQPAWSMHLVVPSEGPLVEKVRQRGVEVILLSLPAAVEQAGDFGVGTRAGDQMGRFKLTSRILLATGGLARFGANLPTLDLTALAHRFTPVLGILRVGLVATLGRWKGHAVFLRALAPLPAYLLVRGYSVGGAMYANPEGETLLAVMGELAGLCGLAPLPGVKRGADSRPGARGMAPGKVRNSGSCARFPHRGFPPARASTGNRISTLFPVMPFGKSATSGSQYICPCVA